MFFNRFSMFCLLFAIFYRVFGFFRSFLLSVGLPSGPLNHPRFVAPPRSIPPSFRRPSKAGPGRKNDKASKTKKAKKKGF